jgi:hypothetical protein
MKIKNIDGLTAFDLQEAVNGGGRFIYYVFTVSLIIVTFKGTSGVYLVRDGESVAGKGIAFSLLSFLFGWWGFPFGPKYTLQSLRTNLRGGKNVTNEVMETVEGYMMFEKAQRRDNR